jgi:hypothetical protein
MCPYGQQGELDCKIGNNSLSSVGVTQILPTFNKQPLTWAVGMQVQQATMGKTFAMERTYYLGAPHGDKFKKSQDQRGCAVFLEGVTGNLAWPQSYPGTCSEALGDTCSTELLEQVRVTMNQLIRKNGPGYDKMCLDLASALQHQAPLSCKIANKNSTDPWGEVVAKGKSTESCLVVQLT